MAKTAVGGADFGPDDWGRLLSVAGLLAALGLLPRKWQAAVTVAGAAYAVWRLL